jgi:hypothetical protein
MRFRRKGLILRIFLRSFWSSSKRGKEVWRKGVGVERGREKRKGREGRREIGTG